MKCYFDFSKIVSHEFPGFFNTKIFMWPYKIIRPVTNMMIKIFQYNIIIDNLRIKMKSFFRENGEKLFLILVYFTFLNSSNNVYDCFRKKIFSFAGVFQNFVLVYVSVEDF